MSSLAVSRCTHVRDAYSPDVLEDKHVIQ